MLKGVSPLLGAPLLILLTVSVAIIVSGWLTDFSKEQTSSIANTTEEQLACKYAQVYIRSVTYNCNNSCAAGIPHNLTAYVENTGASKLTIDKLYVEINTGALYTFNLNETKTLSTGDLVYLTNISSANCSAINNSIANVRVISLNCPDTAHDKLPGEDVSYVNC